MPVLEVLEGFPDDLTNNSALASNASTPSKLSKVSTSTIKSKTLLGLKASDTTCLFNSKLYTAPKSKTVPPAVPPKS